MALRLAIGRSRQCQVNWFSVLTGINGPTSSNNRIHTLEMQRNECEKNPVLTQKRICNVVSTASKRNYGSIYEPEYLDSTGPEIPSYDVLNIQIKGYDFAILEKFTKHVHHSAERIGLSVEDAWPTPAKKLRVPIYKPESTVVETEYALNLYERNVQIADVPATLLPVFVNVIEASIPTGVSLRVHPHLPEHSEIRYVPDLQLKELKTQLDTMRGEKK